MGKKSRRKTSQKRRERSVRFKFWFFLALFVVVGGAIHAVRMYGPSPGTASVPFRESRRVANRSFYENPEEAKPFPATLEPSRFGGSIVSRAYEVAREIPEVLVQQPCHCNCEVLGHRSLLDCYVSYHAASCSACLQEAILAQRMTAAGNTPSEIREDIEKGLWRRVSLE